MKLTKIETHFTIRIILSKLIKLLENNKNLYHKKLCRKMKRECDYSPGEPGGEICKINGHSDHPFVNIIFTFQYFREVEIYIFFIFHEL